MVVGRKYFAYLNGSELKFIIILFYLFIYLFFIFFIFIFFSQKIG